MLDTTCLCPGCLHGDSECKKAEYVDSWIGFDMSTFMEIDADLNLWKSVKIHKNVSCREDYNWENVWDVLANMNTFEELAEYIKKSPLPFLDFHIKNSLSENDRDHLDLVALHYKPNDAPQDLVPCKIYADGNCLPRTLSFICFHSENMHTEMCVRLVYESVLNAKYYLSNRHLARGSNILYRRGGPCTQIAMYSSAYNHQDQFDVVAIYKKESMQIARDGEYCGLWQLSQAANILRRPVCSVYPTELHEGMRLEFNRKFMCIDTRHNNKNSVYIMWTPMQVSKNSYPVHFVPLLKAVSVYAKCTKIRKIRKITPFATLLNLSVFCLFLGLLACQLLCNKHLQGDVLVVVVQLQAVVNLLVVVVQVVHLDNL